MLENEFLHYDENIKQKNHNTNKYNETDRMMYVLRKKLVLMIMMMIMMMIMKII